MTMTTTSLKQAWTLWEQEEKSWENAKAESKPWAYEPPEADKKIPEYEVPKVTVLQKDTPSGNNTLAVGDKTSYVPGKDKDAKVTQLKTELAKLEEALMELGDIEEAFMTPDVGTSVLGRSLFTGGAVVPPNGYERNFMPDPTPPEEGGGFRDSDCSAAILAPQHFVPKEGALSEGVRNAHARAHAEHNHQVRLSKIRRSRPDF